MKYRVERNRCGCHPETCCCDPYNVKDPNGNIYVRVGDYQKAEKIAKALNHLESFRGKQSGFSKVTD